MEKKIDNIREIDYSKILNVSAIPHLKTTKTTNKIMLDVIIAMMPSLLIGVYVFGIRSLLLVGCSVLSCVLSEYVYQKIMKKTVQITDLSAVVTGILLAFNVPVTLPIPMIILGGIFSIIVVKQLFGGIGCNFMNPALAGRAFIMASWAQAMSHYTAPLTKTGVDASTYATPLSGGQMVTLMDAFLGNVGGTIGEVSALALLLGACYLIIRKVIRLTIPITYIISVSVVLVICGTKITDIPLQICLGGIILGAFFMATDYVTCPISTKGQIIFAIGCGFFTAIIRAFGNLPEGVSYSILIMNAATPLIEKVTVPKPFGRGGKKE